MSPSPVQALQENTYLFIASDVDIRRRTLAHEIWHGLTRQEDVASPLHVFAPYTLPAVYDADFALYRRITHLMEGIARTPKDPGDLTPGGSRLLQ